MQTWAQNTVESCRTRMIAGQTTYAVDENGMLVASQDAVEKDADRKLLNSIVVNLEKYNKFRAEEGKPAVTGILVKGASDGVFTGPLLYQLRAPELDLPPITIDDGVAKVSQLLIDCNVRSVETINGLGHLKAADRLLQGSFKRIPSKMSFDSLVDGRNAFMNAVVDEKPKNGFISAPNLKRGNFMFSGSNMLEEVKIGKGGFEFPNIETAVGMFKIAALNSVEECSFPNLVDADHMFYHTRIKNGGAKRIDAPKAVTANVMFAYSDVQKIGRVQLPAAKNCVGMFEKCEKLRQIMKLDIPTVEHAESVMKSCTSLKSVPFLHISASAQTRDAMKHTPLEPVYGSDMQLYKIVIKNIG